MIFFSFLKRFKFITRTRAPQKITKFVDIEHLSHLKQTNTYA